MFVLTLTVYNPGVGISTTSISGFASKELGEAHGAAHAAVVEVNNSQRMKVLYSCSPTREVKPTKPYHDPELI